MDLLTSVVLMALVVLVFIKLCLYKDVMKYGRIASCEFTEPHCIRRFFNLLVYVTSC